MNELEKLIANLQQHLPNHDGKECEARVVVDGKSYRLTGGVSTYGNSVSLFATTTGQPSFDYRQLKKRYYVKKRKQA